MLRCESGHSFDKARSGYVNLLRSQQSALKRHGDDKRMLQARRTFLDRGFYEPLQRVLCETVADRTPDNGVVLDAGCGEGYYTAAITKTKSSLTVCGIDISKDALQMASARSKTMELAVASVFSLPVADGTTDAVVSVFAPTAQAEFARVLKTGGVLIFTPLALGDHLTERTELDGFRLVHRQELSYELTLETAEDIRALFEMTPYYYKTGQDDQARVLARCSLCTEIGFAVLTYVKL